MLLDALEPDKEARGPLQTVLRARLDYLEHRAHQVRERDVPPGETDAWRHWMTEVGLRLEAAETAATIGAFARARRQLERGCAILMDVGLPFGLFLRVGLDLDRGREWARSEDGILEEWTTWWVENVEGATLEAPGSEAPGQVRALDPGTQIDRAASLVEHAKESPQQWAYLALAIAMKHPEQLDLPRYLRWSAVPVGRMRLPMNHYLSIASYCRIARQREITHVPEGLSSTIQVIAKNMNALAHANSWARENSYLWEQMLAPAPLFDCESAALVGCVLSAGGPIVDIIEGWRNKLMNAGMLQYAGQLSRAIEPGTSDYAREFIDAVSAIRDAGKDTRGDRSA